MCEVCQPCVRPTTQGVSALPYRVCVCEVCETCVRPTTQGVSALALPACGVITTGVIAVDLHMPHWLHLYHVYDLTSCKAVDLCGSL